VAFLAPVAAFLGSAAGASTMAGVGIGLSAYGMVESAKAGRKAATAERVASGFEADQLDQRAKDTVAAGSFRADQISKRAKEIIASQRAVAAANGGDTTDATAQAFANDTIRKASIESLLEMANAESDSRKDKLQALQTRETGQRMGNVMRNNARGQAIGQAGTILSGAADWAEKFGGKKTPDVGEL